MSFQTFLFGMPISRLCPGDQCSSWDSEGPLFFDGDHLTGHGNQILYPFFRQSVENAWGLHCITVELGSEYLPPQLTASSRAISGWTAS